MYTFDMIHTIVEGLLQQLSTAFVAATGKGHWSTTSKRDQQSCPNGTSASTRVRVSTPVEMSSQPHEIIAASLTPMKYQKYPNVPNTAKTIPDIVTHLLHNPWEDSFQDWVLHRRMSHTQPRTHFQKDLEQHQKHL